MSSTKTLLVQEKTITVTEKDFLSLTDMAKAFGDDTLIYNWMRNRNTVEFLGLWETINNPNFKGIEFDTFRNQAGLNSFSLTPKKWIEATQAIGIISKAGRYGGTYAHKDIAIEFGSWLSPEFKLYLIVEFQRMKEEENRRLSLDWQLNRALTKINYRIHTDAIKENLIPPAISKNAEKYIYADEADLLNRVLFGRTANEWRKANPNLAGNIRDYATVEQLIVLNNLENLNAEYIKAGKLQDERAYRLSEIARDQLQRLYANPQVGRIKKLESPKNE